MPHCPYHLPTLRPYQTATCRSRCLPHHHISCVNSYRTYALGVRRLPARQLPVAAFAPTAAYSRRNTSTAACCARHFHAACLLACAFQARCWRLWPPHKLLPLLATSGRHGSSAKDGNGGGNAWMRVLPLHAPAAGAIALYRAAARLAPRAQQAFLTCAACHRCCVFFRAPHAAHLRLNAFSISHLALRTF